jgi:hypothetical protein
MFSGGVRCVTRFLSFVVFPAIILGDGIIFLKHLSCVTAVPSYSAIVIFVTVFAVGPFLMTTFQRCGFLNRKYSYN